MSDGFIEAAVNAQFEPSHIYDGGPAFPTKREVLDPRATGWQMQEGMTLRDWFAGQIANGYATVEDTRAWREGMGIARDEWEAQCRSEDAKYCYQMADAMLAARKEKS